MRYQTSITVEIDVANFDEACDCFDQIEKLIEALFFVKGAVALNIEDVTGI
jgi:hypothetical protein